MPPVGFYTCIWSIGDVAGAADIMTLSLTPGIIPAHTLIQYFLYYLLLFPTPSMYTYLVQSCLTHWSLNVRIIDKTAHGSSYILYSANILIGFLSYSGPGDYFCFE